MSMRNIEIRYMERKSARSLRVWLCHAYCFKTFTAGPAIGVRLFGWGVTVYPMLPDSMK